MFINCYYFSLLLAINSNENHIQINFQVKKYNQKIKTDNKGGKFYKNRNEKMAKK